MFWFWEPLFCKIQQLQNEIYFEVQNIFCSWNFFFWLASTYNRLELRVVFRSLELHEAPIR